MAVENIDIVIKILEKNTKALKKIDTQLKGIGKSTKSVGKTAAKTGQSFAGMGTKLFALAGGTIIFTKMAGAISDAFLASAKFEATLVSLNKVGAATGRDMNKVFAEMNKQLGGLADKTNVATGFLKGLTTELTVEQIAKMTQAIKDASIAMGEDFNVQLPLITKAVKQLNPAILDNIGVTVRLDRINTRIKQGYFGLNREVNEATQQHAIFVEIMKQTAKFTGQEAAFLQTTAGQVQALTAALTDLNIQFGDSFRKTLDVLGGSEGFVTIIAIVRTYIAALAEIPNLFTLQINVFNAWLLFVKRVFRAAGEAAIAFGRLLATAMDPTKILELPQAIETFAEDISQSFRNIPAQFGIAIRATEKSATDLTAIWEKLAEVFNSTKEIFNQEPTLDARFEQMKLRAEEFAEFMEDEFLDATDTALQGIPNTLKKVQFSFQKLSAVGKATFRALDGAFNNAIGNIVGSLGFLQTESTGVFKQMAADFMRFFVEEVLRMAVAFLVPKLLKILGSIFDTQANDRMAAVQGKHFIQHFARGATAELAALNLGPSLVAASPAVIAGSTPAPQMMGGGGITINFTGPVTDEQFVRDSIVPVIESAALDGGSRLAINDQNITGGSNLAFT